MNIEDIIKDLETVEKELLAEAKAEKIGGNVVKEATYNGQANGVRISIAVVQNHIAKSRTNQTTNKCDRISIKDRLPDVNPMTGDSDHLLCWELHDETPFVGWYNGKTGTWTVSHCRADSSPRPVVFWMQLPTISNEQDDSKLMLNDLERKVEQLALRMKCAEERLRMLENEVKVMKTMDFWKNLQAELKEGPEQNTDSALLEAARKVVRIRYGAQADDGWDQLKNSIAELADVVEKPKD